MSCEKCGKCCQAIYIGHSIKELKSFKNSPDSEFILKNWIRISKKKALEINPFLKTWYGKGGRYFTCNQYDSKNKICKNHKTRPNVCRDYPWYQYKKIPTDWSFYITDCGYNKPENFEQILKIKGK